MTHAFKNVDGRRPPYSALTHPRMYARDILTGSYSGAVPAVVDWHTNVSLPMDLNDSLGDCTIADIAHAVGVFTFFGQGAEVVVSSADVLTVYERVGGYRPGNPATDRGCVIQDVLNDWRKTGIAGHQILAFFQVNYTNLAELKACTWLFGGVTLGVNFPQSGMDQFSAGVLWDFSSSANNTIIGGHDIRLLGVDATGMMYVATWGTIQKMTPAWLAHFCEEAWAQADGEWVKNNASPEGLSVAALNAAFQQVTGQPGPFPVAPSPTPIPPNPTPTPVPTPTPTPSVTIADRTLAAAISQHWLSHPGWYFHESRGVADAIQAWLTASGLTPGS